MNRLAIALAIAAVLLLPACGPADSGSLGPLPTERPSTGPSPDTPTTPATGPPEPASPGPPATSPAPAPPAPGMIAIELWFTRDGGLVRSNRSAPATPATSRLALAELSVGPAPIERRAGLGNGVPADLAYDISIADGVATLDVPGSFYAGGRAAARLRQAQVVYTLTQFPTVSAVGFQSDGEPLGAPVGRADYADLLPAIVVTSPAIGQLVTSPVTVAGTADVFEATVSVRILDAAGTEVATTFTTATCGTGCRGDYSVAVPYRVSREQWGTVQVYEVSAADGSRTKIVDIPVRLAPTR